MNNSNHELLASQTGLTRQCPQAEDFNTASLVGVVYFVEGLVISIVDPPDSGFCSYLFLCYFTIIG